MKFVVSGGYGYGNVGDEAQLAGVIDEIRTHFEGSSITALSPNVNYTNSQHEVDKVVLASRVCVFHQFRFPWLYNIRNKRNDSLVKNFANRVFKGLFWVLLLSFLARVYVFQKTRIWVGTKQQGELVKEIESADVLFISGGGYLTEATLSRLLDTSMLILSAGILQTKVLVSGQTIGHIRGRCNSLIFRKALNSCKLVSTRDPDDSIQSLEQLLTEKEFDSKVLFTSDDALFVSGVESTSEYDGYVGLQLHYWGDAPKDEVLKFYKAVVDKLISLDVNDIVLFSMHPSDEGALADLAALCPSVRLFKYEYDYKEIISFIKDLKFIVSMKHHPLIFAMGGGKPVISINFSEYYEHKNIGALKNFDLSRFTSMLNYNDMNYVLGLIEELCDDKNNFGRLLSDRLNDARLRRMSYWQRVKDITS